MIYTVASVITVLKIKIMSNSYNRDTTGKFKGKGIGLKKDIQTINVRFPPEIDAILRGMENRSEYIRNAVIRQLQRDGHYIDVDIDDEETSEEIDLRLGRSELY